MNTDFTAQKNSVISVYPVFPVDGDQLLLFVDFTHFFFQRDCREYDILVHQRKVA